MGNIDAPVDETIFDIEKEIDDLLPIEVKEQSLSNLLQAAMVGVVSPLCHCSRRSQHLSSGATLPSWPLRACLVTSSGRGSCCSSLLQAEDTSHLKMHEENCLRKISARRKLGKGM